MRIYGLTLEGSDDVADGTGIDVPKLGRLSARGLGKATIAVVMFSGIDPIIYKPIFRELRQLGHKTMARVVDSFAMKDYSVRAYRNRYQDVVKKLDDLIDIYECGNELSGNWLGEHSVEKTREALKVCARTNKPRAITLFFDNSIPQYMGDWAKTYPLAAEYVFASDYVASYLDTMTPISTVISQLAKIYPTSLVGIGEYGMNIASGADVATDEQRAAMVTLFEGRKLVDPRDIGGGFYWSAYKDLLCDDSKLLPVFKRLWG